MRWSVVLAGILVEPLGFILWGSVAMALLFWGELPFCGWLCCFPCALQGLITRFAKSGHPSMGFAWGLA